MHEYGIAYDLYATARRAALENKADRVLKVNVDVGKLAMVNPDQVIFLFGIIKEEDPLFPKTTLECREVPPETSCSCGYHGSEIHICPNCGALPEIVKGREIVVTNIEIEVDD